MHVSLYVSDLQQTKQFYNLFFDRPPTKEKAAYIKYELEEPSLIISFIEHPDRVQAAFGHLGFQLDSQEALNATIQRVNAAGLASLEEKGTACCYAIQDKVWVTDPDGVQWEVYYFHEDVEFNDPRYELEQTEQCCVPASKTKIQLSELTKTACC